MVQDTKYARNTISNGAFYIPFCYLYQVRLGTMAKLLSWALLYIFPTLFYAALSTHMAADDFALMAIDYALLLVAVICVYELGYIHNDTFTIRREQHPTRRLYPHNEQFFADHWRSVFLTRLSVSTLILAILLWRHATQPIWWLTVASVALIFPLFLAYNACRTRHNVWLYPLLVFSRYWPLVLPFVHASGAWRLIGWLYLSFPLVNALERFSMSRYRWPWMRPLIPNEQSKTRFRLIYYAAMSVFATALALRLRICCYELIPIYTLCLYRLTVWIITLRYTPKNYLKG